MDNVTIENKLDIMQELTVELRKELADLRKQLMVISERENDMRHVLNPVICKMPAHKIAQVVSEYRNLLGERTMIKQSIRKIEMALNLKGIDLSNVPTKISQKNQNVYNVKRNKDVFVNNSKYIISNISVNGKIIIKGK